VGIRWSSDRKSIKNIIQKKLYFITHKMYGEYNSNENESKCLRNNAFVNLLLSDSEDDTKLVVTFTRSKDFLSWLAIGKEMGNAILISIRII
jgi:hypothetical protein